MKTLILTCTPDKFDIVSFFQNNEEIVWKQTASCEVGYYAYIYVGRPISSLRYCCEVIETNIVDGECLPYHCDTTMPRSRRQRRYMRLKLLREIKNNELSLERLRAHGLKTVQCITVATDELKEYIEKTVREQNLL